MSQFPTERSAAPSGAKQVPSARKGKIASLPADIRREVNKRLSDGQKGPEILAFLNAHPVVKRILEAYYESEPISASNLSQWRNGGYQDYLAEQERVDHIRTLSQFSLDLSRAAGGNLAEGPAAIAAGRLLSMIELADEENLGKLVQAITAIRSTELESKKLAIAETKLAQNERSISLAETKFQRDSVNLFMKWFDDKVARDIAASSASKSLKLEKLITRFFGAKPQTQTP